MKELPLLFKPEMVRAILDGRKTQTRRLYKLDVINQEPDEWELKSFKDGIAKFQRTGHFIYIKCPYWADEYWVREAFWIDHIDYIEGRLPKEKPQVLEENPDMIMYHADGSCCEQLIECECSEVGKPKIRPSIYMPRWASRIQLLRKDIRVERLQDISDIDALAEGIQWDDHCPEGVTNGYCPGAFDRPSEAFMCLWDSINGKKYPWSGNYWVWVPEFERIKP